MLNFSAIHLGPEIISPFIFKQRGIPFFLPLKPISSFIPLHIFLMLGLYFAIVVFVIITFTFPDNMV